MRPLLLVVGGESTRHPVRRVELSLLLALLVFALFLTSGCDSPSTDVSEPSANASADAPPGGGPPGGGPPAWILEAVAQPRGVILNKPEATPGYVMYASLTGSSTYMVDQEGKLVHRWTNDLAAGANYLQENGDLLRMARIPEPENFRAGGVAGYIQRLSWDSEVLWQWQLGDDQRVNHHDIEPLPNGNILVVAWEQKSRDEALALGFLPESVPETGLWSEWLLEIEPKPPSDARVVWEWHVWDHLIQDKDPDKPNYGEPKNHPTRLDVNGGRDAPEIDEEELAQLKAMGYVPDNATVEDLQSDFLHLNAIDYNADLDQIAVSLPEIGEVWILDHSTTTEQARGSTGGRAGHGGDILYRWGNPATYGRGTKQDQKLFYQHQVQWIHKGYPGAGNLTIFNNGQNRLEEDHSSIEEITPPIAGDGSYTLATDQPYGPTTPAWRYTAPDRESFFSPFISGVHRLENGNTFICSGPQGRFFEVTPEGEIVWEFRNPFHEVVAGWQPDGTEDLVYAAFRATKIMPNHPGLAGRELAPLSPQPEWFVPPARGEVPAE